MICASGSHIAGPPPRKGADDRAPSPFQVFLDENRDAVWRFLVSSVGPSEADDCFQECSSRHYAPIHACARGRT